MGHRLHVTVCLQRRARMESYFRRATLRCAPEVFQRCTSTMYHVGGHGAQEQARMQLKAITREGSVDACCGCTFFSNF